MTTETVMTVDADTLLDDDATYAMRVAFASEPKLVAAAGILVPVCGKTVSGRVFQWFQTYEYMRNFIARFAWMRADSLLLISGAFASFRRDALVDVGGPRMGRGSSALGAFKAALHLLGVIDCPLMALPQLPLDEAEVARVGDYLRTGGLL